MRKSKKIFSVALAATLAMTAIPVSGSFAVPAIVKAEEVAITIDSSAYATVNATAVGYNKVEIASSDQSSSPIATTLASEDTYKYVWVSKNDVKEIVAAMQTDAAKALETPDGANKINLTTLPTDKMVLAIIKTKDVNFKDIKAPLAGKVFEFTRAKDFAAGTFIKASNKITELVDATDEFKILDNKLISEVTDEEKKENAAWTAASSNEAAVPAPTAGKVKTVLVRTKATGTTFASLPKLFYVTDPSGIQALKFKVNDKEAKAHKLVIEHAEVKSHFDTNSDAKDIMYMVNAGAETALKKNVTEDIEIPVKNGDKVTFFVKDESDAAYQYTITMTQTGTVAGITRTGKKQLTGFSGKGYEIRKDGGTFTAQDDNIYNAPSVGKFEIRKPVVNAATAVFAGNNTGNVELHSEIAFITLTESDNVSQADVAAVERVSHKVAEEEKNAEEAKKEDPKKEEPKKDDTKTEAPKTEEPKTETPSEEAPVNKTVSSKKAAATVSAEDVALVTGKLTVKVKGATLALPKAVLSDGAVKVSLKASTPKKDSKDAKALTKNLKKNKLVDKNVYSLSVKTGTKGVNGKFTVTLSTSLKKAPKNLYVMNIANGKLMKAKFSKGKVTFTAGKAGKFVVVSK